MIFLSLKKVFGFYGYFYCLENIVTADIVLTKLIKNIQNCPDYFCKDKFSQNDNIFFNNPNSEVVLDFFK